MRSKALQLKMENKCWKVNNFQHSLSKKKNGHYQITLSIKALQELDHARN